MARRVDAIDKQCVFILNVWVIGSLDTRTIASYCFILIIITSCVDTQYDLTCLLRSLPIVIKVFEISLTSILKFFIFIQLHGAAVLFQIYRGNAWVTTGGAAGGPLLLILELLGRLVQLIGQPPQEASWEEAQRVRADQDGCNDDTQCVIVAIDGQEASKVLLMVVFLHRVHKI